MVKNSKKQEKNPQLLLRDKYLSLDKNNQEGVTSFFNAHNTAAWIFSQLSDDAKAYVNYCISLTQNADKIEKENEKKDV